MKFSYKVMSTAAIAGIIASIPMVAHAAAGDFYNQTKQLKYARTDLVADKNLQKTLQGQLDAGDVVVKQTDGTNYVNYKTASDAFAQAYADNGGDISKAITTAFAQGKVTVTPSVLDAYPSGKSTVGINVSSVSAITKTDVTVKLAAKPATALADADASKFTVTVDGVANTVKNVAPVVTDTTGLTYKLTLTNSLDKTQGVLSVNGVAADVINKGLDNASAYNFDFKAPEIKSVQVVDKNRIKVTFSEKMSNAAATAANYSLKQIGGAAAEILSGGSGVLSADRMSATFTLTAPLAPAQYSFAVITANVVDVASISNMVYNGTTLYFAPTADQLVDTVAPTLAKATYNRGTKVLELTFDKTVDYTKVTKSGITLGGVKLSDSDTLTTSANGTAMDITLSAATAAKLPAGDLTVSLDANSFYDIATTANGLGAVANAAVSLVTPATIQSVAYDQLTDKLTVTFDQAVTLTDLSKMTIADGTNSFTLSGLTPAETGSNKTFTFTLTGANLTSIESTMADKTKIKAYFNAANAVTGLDAVTGNLVGTYTDGTAVTYTKDAVKPVIADAKLTYDGTDTKVVLTFNKAVADFDANKANFKIVDAAGKVITDLTNAATVAYSTDKTVATLDIKGKGANGQDTVYTSAPYATLTNADDLLNAAYSNGVTFGLVYTASTYSDTNNNNADAVTTTAPITVAYKDYYAPTLVSVAPVAAQDNTHVLVKFTEKVDKATAENVNNYNIVKSGTTEKLNVTAATLQYDGMSVMLTTDAQSYLTTDGYTLTASAVKDLQGNVLVARNPLTVTFTGKADADTAKLKLDGTAPFTVNAVENGTDYFTVKFSADVDPTTALNKANYTILKKGTALDYSDATAVSLANATLTLDDSKTVKISSPDFAIKTADKYGVTVANIVTKLGVGLDTTLPANITKNDIVNTKDTTVTKPTGIAYAEDTNDQIVLTFTEELDKAAAENKANYTLSGLTPGSKIDSAVYAWDATNKKATVTLTLSSDATKLSGTTSVTVGTNVVDLAGNALTAPNQNITGIVVVDGAKPTVTSVTGTTVAGLDNDTIAIKFNKLVRQADAENPANYTIILANGTSVKVSDLKKSGAAVPDIAYDGAGTVKIKLDNTGTGNDGKKYNLVNGTGKVSVAVSGVKDLAGNVIDTVTKAGDVSGDSVAPDIANTASLSGTYTVQFAFTEAIDASTFTKDDVKLTVDGTGDTVTINSVELGTDLSTVTITAATPLDSSKQYDISSVTGTSVKDLAGNEATSFTTRTTAAYTAATMPTAVVAPTINAANVSNVTVTGTTAHSTDVGTILVTLSDGTHSVTGTVVKTDATSANFSVTGIDASTLTDGTTLTVTAKLTNSQGFASGVKNGSTFVKDVAAPVAAVTTATVAAGADVTTAQSNKLGIVYLVKSTDTVTDAASLEALVTGSKAKKATVSTINTNTTIATTSLAAGTYNVYAVDAAGNVSAASVNSITVTAPLADATAPTSIALTTGSSHGATVGHDVTMPAAGGTDATGTVTGWATGTTDTIKFTVANGGTATSSITINGSPYTSGADYTIAAATPLTIVVTTSEAGKATVTRTFTVSVTA